MIGALTATNALVALGVGSALTLALLFVVVRARRSGRAERQQRLALVSELTLRLEGTVRELSEALERVQEEGRRNRFLGELGASIDLDEVLSRTLEAGAAIPGVDAALVSIRGSGEQPIVATVGLSAEEAQRQAISGPPDGHEARAISIVYQYPPTLEDSSVVHAGLAVPVPGEAGNVVITGHRDTFFRHIHELQKGDTVVVQRDGKTFRYEVTGKKIVEPTDVSVLQPTNDSRMTLITCYPFNYIGPAPKRLVVFSKLVGDKEPDQQRSGAPGGQ
jgi:LPXTG-site transpeptidase (sortase) family protein